MDFSLSKQYARANVPFVQKFLRITRYVELAVFSKKQKIKTNLIRRKI